LRVAFYPLNNSTADVVASLKDVSYDLLSALGFSVPKWLSAFIHDQSNKYKYADVIGPSAEEIVDPLYKLCVSTLGFPANQIVVKPNASFGGNGASIGLGGPGVTETEAKEQLLQALKRANTSELKQDAILIQEMIQATEYRITILNGLVVGANSKDALHVIGNGKSTLKELMKAEEQNPVRVALNSGFVVSSNVEKLLKKQGIQNLDEVIANGQRVYLNTARNIHQSGMPVDVVDSMHPTFKALFEDLSIKCGLNWNGLDVFVTDITKDAKEEKYWVCEVNSRAGTRSHHFPMAGKSRNVCRAGFAAMFPTLKDHPLYNTEGGPAPNPTAITQWET